MNSSIWIAIIPSVLATLIATYLLPMIFRPIYKGFNMLLAKFYSKFVFDLSGEWQAKFTERDPTGNIRQVTENVTLTQKGTYIKAKGSTTGDNPRKFRYTGELIQNLVLGEYRKEKIPRGTVIGSGSFVLQIAPDVKSMAGKCIWFDSDHHTVETSEYEWNRVP